MEQYKSQQQPDIQQTKPHYEILDGMRGIAAIIVVLFHIYEIIVPDYTKSIFAHGFLAVDFFFCLSGFVIGYAYDDRIHKIGLKKFFINRLIRLQPLVIWGSVLGLIAFLFDPFLPVSPVAEFGWGKILFAFLCSALMLPCPILGRYGNVFPLNAPAWSLCMEYYINLVYAFVLVRISKTVLLIFLGIAAVWIVYISWYRGNIMGGWSDATFADGYARVCFSFLAGLTIYRLKGIVRNRIPFLVYAAVLAGTFLFPHSDKDWITEISFVMIIFPLLVALGSGARVKGIAHKICVFLGNLSYPLYMVHYWMMWILGNYAATNPGERNLYIFSGGIVITAIILAWVSLKCFDEPVRKKLTALSKNGKKTRL
ncbi:MAG: acyltransferase [Niabella sp.]